MKKILLLSITLLMIISSLKTMAETPVSAPFLGISISFSTRSYWDGTTKSCLPRPRGWCLHFDFDAITPVGEGTIRGELSNLATTGLTLTLYKKTGVTPETFSRFFKNGTFTTDGEGTIDGEILRKLGLPQSFTIPEGAYNYKDMGDQLVITFRK